MQVLTKEDSSKTRAKTNSNSSALLFGLEKVIFSNPFHVHKKCNILNTTIIAVAVDQSNKKQIWWKANDAMEHAAWVKKLTECMNKAPGFFTNLKLAEVLGKTDLDFENFNVFVF